MDFEPEKILVAGDVDGFYNDLFKKVQKVDSSHGKFSFLLVAGNFFGESEADWSPYKNGSKSVPIDTFILGPKNSGQLKFYPDFKSTSSNMKLVERLTCLGKLGVFVTSSGLTIAYLSGLESRDSSLCGFSESDAFKFMNLIDENRKYKPVDIFITLQWPRDITPEHETKNHSSLLQMIVKSIVPRYIFCATEGVWFKRAPYNNDEPYTRIITRFIALGKINTKEKWIYALELTKDNPDTRKPIHCVNPSPFKDITIKSNPEDQYRWDLTRYSDQESKNSNNSKPFRKRKRADDADCWFCLSSPKVEKHLIISIGKDTYVARAKGGLVDDHLLISTVTHMKCFSKVSEHIKIEIAKFKKSIGSYFKEKGCSPIFFERNLDNTLHFQIDAVPIPQKKCSSLKAVFEEYAKKYELEIEWYSGKSKFEFPYEDSLQYFYAELPSSEVLFIRIADRFPVLFARYILADDRILNQTERINWRKCSVSHEEETELSRKVRDDFKAYDCFRK